MPPATPAAFCTHPPTIEEEPRAQLWLLAFCFRNKRACIEKMTREDNKCPAQLAGSLVRSTKGSKTTSQHRYVEEELYSSDQLRSRQKKRRSKCLCVILYFAGQSSGTLCPSGKERASCRRTAGDAEEKAATRLHGGAAPCTLFTFLSLSLSSSLPHAEAGDGCCWCLCDICPPLSGCPAW